MPLLCAATLIDTSKISPILKFYCMFWLYIENHLLVEVVRYHWRSPSPASTGQSKITQSRLFRAGYTWDSVRISEDRDTTISLCNLFQCFTTLRIILDFLLLFDGISCTSICVCWTIFERSGSSSLLTRFSYTLVSCPHVFSRLNSPSSLNLSWYVRNSERWSSFEKFVKCLFC